MKPLKTTAISIQPYDRFSFTLKGTRHLATRVDVVTCPRSGNAMLDIFTGLDPMPLYTSPVEYVYIHEYA